MKPLAPLYPWVMKRLIILQKLVQVSLSLVRRTICTGLLCHLNIEVIVFFSCPFRYQKKEIVKFSRRWKCRLASQCNKYFSLLVCLCHVGGQYNKILFEEITWKWPLSSWPPTWPRWHHIQTSNITCIWKKHIITSKCKKVTSLLCQDVMRISLTNTSLIMVVVKKMSKLMHLTEKTLDSVTRTQHTEGQSSL